MRTSDDPIQPVADITGIIMPHNWNAEGKVIQIALYTHKEEVYLVEHNQIAKELLNCINKKVAVKGKIFRGNHPKQCIVVKNYSVLAEDADDEKSMI